LVGLLFEDERLNVGRYVGSGDVPDLIDASVVDV